MDVKGQAPGAKVKELDESGMKKLMSLSDTLVKTRLTKEPSSASLYCNLHVIERRVDEEILGRGVPAILQPPVQGDVTQK